GIAKPGAICLSEDAYRQVKSRLDLALNDLGAVQLKNIAEPMRAYSLEIWKRGVVPPEPAAPKALSTYLPPIAGIVALIIVASSSWYFGHAVFRLDPSTKEG